jgi:hypothetical protein
MEKIMVEVDPRCRRSPLTSHHIDSFCTSGISSLVTSHGPSGPKVSCDLPLVHCPRRSIWKLRSGADDGGDFDFPVELGRSARLLDLVVRSAQRGVGLQEEDRLGRNLRTGFLGMIDIVQPDGDEFRDAGHRRADSRLAIDGGEL